MEIAGFVQVLLRRLEEAGHEAWCVGGCVRDGLLGKTPQDWDVTTSARPEEVLALFAAQAQATGLQHGTVSVYMGDGWVEVTTYRRDGAYSDHRRPDEVYYTHSLDEDLARRDFTVNAMAMDLRGQLRDPFGGQADLSQRTLRCVGDPDRRFVEDGLRILRALRFSACIPLEIAPDTAQSLHRSRQLLWSIAPERIQKELTGLLCGPRAASVLREYGDVVGVFWPEVLACVGFAQHNPHHCYDVWEHTLHALSHTPPELEVRLSVLLHDVG